MKKVMTPQPAGFFFLNANISISLRPYAALSDLRSPSSAHGPPLPMPMPRPMPGMPGGGMPGGIPGMPGEADGHGLERLVGTMGFFMTSQSAEKKGFQIKCFQNFNGISRV